MAKAAKKDSTPKGLRYRIFARDNYTCRYCGNQPPEVKLVIDHVIPRAKGGTDDEANLLVACEACNLGKGAKRLCEHVPTDADGWRMSQEYLEQIDLAKLSRRACKARKRMFQEWVNYLCHLLGRNEVKRRSITRVCALVDEFGAERVTKWIDIAATHTSKSDEDLIRYLNEFVRGFRSNQESARKGHRECDECEEEATEHFCEDCGNCLAIAHLCESCCDEYEKSFQRPGREAPTNNEEAEVNK